MIVKIKRAKGSDPGLPLPAYQTKGAAGVDLYAHLDWSHVTLRPGGSVVIRSGIQIQVPEGHEAQVRGRSGLAFKFDVHAPHSPGTIDSDFRGEVMVKVRNDGETDFVIRHGDRVAQMVIAPVTRVEFKEVDTLEDTERGTNGFGSTGISTKSVGTDDAAELRAAMRDALRDGRDPTSLRAVSFEIRSMRS